MQDNFIFEWLLQKDKEVQIEILCSLHAINSNQKNIPRFYNNGSNIDFITKPIAFFKQLDQTVEEKCTKFDIEISIDQIETILGNDKVIYDHLRVTPFKEDYLYKNAPLSFIKKYNLHERNIDSQNFNVVYSKYIQESKFDNINILELAIKDKVNLIWKNKWENCFDNNIQDSQFILSLYEFKALI